MLATAIATESSLLPAYDAEQQLHQLSIRVHLDVAQLGKKLGAYAPQRSGVRSQYPGLKGELVALGVSEETAAQVQAEVNKGYSGGFDYYVKQALFREVYGPHVLGMVFKKDLRPGEWVVGCTNTNPSARQEFSGMVVMTRGDMTAYLALPLRQADHHRASRQVDYRSEWLVRVQAPAKVPKLTIPDLPDDDRFEEAYHPDYTPEARKARRTVNRTAQQGRFDLGGADAVMLPKEVAMQILFFHCIHQKPDSDNSIFGRFPALVSKEPKLTNDEILYRLFDRLTPSELTAELMQAHPTKQRFLWASGLDSAEADAKVRDGE